MRKRKEKSKEKETKRKLDRKTVWQYEILCNVKLQFYASQLVLLLIFAPVPVFGTSDRRSCARIPLSN
jgi:hypothetical protein